MDTIRAVWEWIQANPFLDFLILIAIPSIFEVSKIEINPWSWLGKKIGSFLNHDVLVRLDEVDKRMDAIEKEQVRSREETEEEKANAARRRILRCNDELRADVKHTLEFFNNILDDCTFYLSYCRAHPEYKNERANMAIENIEAIYRECNRTNNFL